MLRKLERSLAVALLAAPLFALPAAAQMRPTRPVTKIDFGEPAVIEGQLQGPSGTYGISKRPSKFASMIKVRVNFHDELLRSVDSL
jgi:hypothetical protein